MNRAQSIRFKLMPDGHIRAFDSRKMSGISEANIFAPPCIAPTIQTKADHIKLMITDERINNALMRSLARTWPR